MSSPMSEEVPQLYASILVLNTMKELNQKCHVKSVQKIMCSHSKTRSEPVWISSAEHKR